MPNKRSPEAIKRRKSRYYDKLEKWHSNDKRMLHVPKKRFSAPSQKKFKPVNLLKNNLDNQRRDAIRNHHPFCSICGYKQFIEALEIHHKNKNSNDHRIENLVVLCRNCHRLLHLELIYLDS